MKEYKFDYRYDPLAMDDDICCFGGGRRPEPFTIPELQKLTGVLDVFEYMGDKGGAVWLVVPWYWGPWRMQRLKDNLWWRRPHKIELHVVHSWRVPKDAVRA